MLLNIKIEIIILKVLWACIHKIRCKTTKMQIICNANYAKSNLLIKIITINVQIIHAKVINKYRPMNKVLLYSKVINKTSVENVIKF